MTARRLALAALVAGLTLAGLALHHALAALPPLDLTEAAWRSTVLDRQDRLLRPFATADGRWRLPRRRRASIRACSPC